MMLAPGGLVDECVRTEFGSYVEELDVTGRYSEASLATADYECEHGRLAGDPCPSPTIVASQAWPNLGLRKGDVVQNWPHRFPCGCFAHEPAPAYIDLTPKEPLMLTAAPERAALPAGPPVDDDAAAIAEALTAAANIEPAKPKRVTRVVHSTGVPLLDKIVADIDAEIARLEAFRAILVETRA